MCHKSCIIYAVKSLTENEISGRKVLEIGSYDVNGSLRPLIESWNPEDYIGVDIEKGPGVDLICDAEDIVRKFGIEKFDVIIATELLEHVLNWKKVISNIKNLCKPNGIIIITTRSYGYTYHGAPHDYWRYELEDFKQIFSDCNIKSLEKDYQHPGIFAKIKKPKKFVEKDLSDYKLYNIISNKKVIKISNKDFRTFYYLKL